MDSVVLESDRLQVLDELLKSAFGDTTFRYDISEQKAPPMTRMMSKTQITLRFVFPEADKRASLAGFSNFMLDRVGEFFKLWGLNFEQVFVKGFPHTVVSATCMVGGDINMLVERVSDILRGKFDTNFEADLEKLLDERTNDSKV